MSKKVYTKEDIYEGMVLECVGVDTDVDYWIVGKQYVVDNILCIYDGDGESRDIYAILDYLNNPKTNLVEFKVVEPEEEHGIVQLFNYTFGLKTGDVETTECYAGGELYTITNNFNKKHITIPAYNTQQAIKYLTNELEYDINDMVSMEVK